MISLPEATRSVYGAYRLARFDPNGMAFLDDSPSGAARSFYAPALLFPFFLLLRATDQWEHAASGLLVPWLITQIVAYVVRCTAFPAAMINIAHVIDRWPRYYAFLAAYNWCHVIQVAVFFPVAAAAMLGILPESVATGLMLSLALLLMVYEGYVIRTALMVATPTAVLLVLADFFLALIIQGFADGLLPIV